MVQLRIRWVAVTVTDALAAVMTAPTALATVRAPGSLGNLTVDGLCARLAVVGLFVTSAWLALGLVAGLLGKLPGALGRVAGWLHVVLVPAAVRRVVAGSAGLGVLLAPVPALASHAPSPTPVPAGTAATSVPPPVWPTTAGPQRVPTHSTPKPPQPEPRPTTDTVTVRPGDSLWLIAARRLGTDATDRAVADYWPSVYAANRVAVGADPDLIQPGRALRLPDPGTKGVTR